MRPFDSSLSAIDKLRTLTDFPMRPSPVTVSETQPSRNVHGSYIGAILPLPKYCYSTSMTFERPQPEPFSDEDTIVENGMEQLQAESTERTTDEILAELFTKREQALAEAASDAIAAHPELAHEEEFYIGMVNGGALNTAMFFIPDELLSPDKADFWKRMEEAGAKSNFYDAGDIIEKAESKREERGIVSSGGRESDVESGLEIASGDRLQALFRPGLESTPLAEAADEFLRNNPDLTSDRALLWELVKKGALNTALKYAPDEYFRNSSADFRSGVLMNADASNYYDMDEALEEFSKEREKRGITD